jgi:putative inorganic carbon (hco3(-)) transporter
MSTNFNALARLHRPGGLLLPGLIAAAAVATIALVVSDSTFLVVALCLGLALTAAFRFEWFVYLQVFLLPWYPLLDMKLPIRDISLVLRFVLLAGVFVIRRQHGKPWREWIFAGRLRKTIWIFAAIVTASLLISALGPNLIALRSLARLFSYLAFFLALIGWIETRQQIESIVKAMLLSTIGVALFGFYQVWDKGYTDLYYHLYPLQEDSLDEWSGRITSFLFHFNSLAGYLNLVLPFSLACMVLAKDRWMRYLATLCHSLTGAGLYFTGSRGGLIAYGGMLLASLWFLKPRRVVLLRVLLAAALSVAVVMSLQRESSGGARLQEVDEFTSASRLALWGAADAMFVQHPVLGVGYGNYRSLYGDYIPGAAPDQLDAHNLYLQFLSETGVIGFAVFFVIISIFVRMAIKLARSHDPFCRLVGIGTGGAIAATLIHGMVDYLFNVSPQFGALFWLVLALGLVAFERRQREEGVA